MKSKLFSLVVLASLGLSACTDVQPESDGPEGKVKVETISVAPKLAGRIQKLYITEGQLVQPGDTLVVLDIPEIAARLEQAEGAVTAAKGQLSLAQHGATADQLQQLQAQVDAAEAQYAFAEVSYKRMQAMVADSLVPAQQFDEVKSKYLAARAQVAAVNAKRQEVQSGTRPETIASARGQLVRAEGARSEVLQAAGEAVILAPAVMVVERINLQEGELATPGYALVSGYLPQRNYFRFTIGERSINGYPIGQKVSIGVPGTATALPATVVQVKQLPRYADNTSTAPNREVGEAFYELKVVPEEASAAAGLYHNSTVFIR